MRLTQGMKGKALWIPLLICGGIILGSVYTIIMNSQGATNTLELEFQNGGLILFPEDRAKIKKQAINVTLEDDNVKTLLVGKNYTIQATIITTYSIQEILQNLTLIHSLTRIIVDGEDIVVVVTLTFEDGSGYNIQIDWRDWTVGEPEFSEEVYPPDPTTRIGPPDSTRRVTP
jgi:hypothetical protein